MDQLGPRPFGDPAGMRTLAGRLRAMANEVDAENASTLRAMRGMHYLGADATKLRNLINFSQFAMASFRSQIEEAAAELERTARNVEREQEAYDKRARALRQALGGGFAGGG